MAEGKYIPNNTIPPSDIGHLVDQARLTTLQKAYSEGPMSHQNMPLNKPISYFTSLQDHASLYIIPIPPDIPRIHAGFTSLCALPSSSIHL